MAKQEITFTFVNPSPPEPFQKQLQKILISKLLYLDEQNRKTGASGK